MSQHILNTQQADKDIAVMMGWDRPLQGYFMNVVESRTNNDKYMYSSSDDPALTACGGFPETVEHFLNQLTQMNISIPEAMLDGVELDGVFNSGNRVVFYNDDGVVVPVDPDAKVGP